MRQPTVITAMDLKHLEIQLNDQQNELQKYLQDDVIRINSRGLIDIENLKTELWVGKPR
jgi:hypothetical protein